MISSLGEVGNDLFIFCHNNLFDSSTDYCFFSILVMSSRHVKVETYLQKQYRVLIGMNCLTLVDYLLSLFCLTLNIGSKYSQKQTMNNLQAYRTVLCAGAI